MASQPSMYASIVALIITAAVTHRVARGADPDPVQDFSVADNDSKIFINGVTSLDPRTATPSHFKTTILATPGNTNNPLGVSVKLTTTKVLPGLNTQGLVMARTDFAKGGVVPPHYHPRVSELIFVVYGTIFVGFVDTNLTLFSVTLKAGDVFVFPRALVHFLQNVGPTPAAALSALNGQNPGTSALPGVLFGSTPPIPSIVLQKSFRIDAQEVADIRKNFGG